MPSAAPAADAPWRLDLPDEGATTDLARQLAALAKPGDLIALSGDLGAGKTFLARAILRLLTGDPELQAPSPTFTLLQTYDGPGYPILHADFFRLKSAGELDNLGWDEACEGALTLLEWPERAGAALGADRLEVALALDPARGASARKAEIRGRGSLAGRLARAMATGALLKRAGWQSAKRDFMQGDASVRAYERLTDADGGTAILMVAPPRPDGPILRYGKPYAAIAKLSHDIRAFIAVAEGLRRQGYSTPRILAYDVANGLALLEDFGAQTIAPGDAPAPERYREATALLADLHKRDLPAKLPLEGEAYELPVYDQEAMIVEVELLLDWYAPHVARVHLASGARMNFLGLWREILAPVLQKAKTWTLRDYHSPNLHWLEGREGLRRLGLIDFQDAVLGPPAYDLASLLQDARVDVPDALELRLLGAYVHRRRQSDANFDVAGFGQAYAVVGAQRATKLLGIFTRLDKRDGKPAYLEHLPRAARTLNKNLAHPALASVRQWLQTHLPRLLEA